MVSCLAHEKNNSKDVFSILGGHSFLYFAYTSMIRENQQLVKDEPVEFEK